MEFCFDLFFFLFFSFWRRGLTPPPPHPTMLSAPADTSNRHLSKDDHKFSHRSDRLQMLPVLKPPQTVKSEAKKPWCQPPTVIGHATPHTERRDHCIFGTCPTHYSHTFLYNDSSFFPPFNQRLSHPGESDRKINKKSLTFPSDPPPLQPLKIEV